MSNKPLWLERLTPKQRAAILTKAHAILLDDTDLGDNEELRKAAGILWTIKRKLERME